MTNYNCIIILYIGAEELGLLDSYIDKLKKIPTSKPSPVLKWLCFQHLFITSFLFKSKKLYFIQKFISRLVLFFYVSSSRFIIFRFLSEICMGLVLLPGGLIGFFSTTLLSWIGRPYKPMFGGLLDPIKSRK